MSLLLDALKQAEESKKQQKTAELDKAESGIQELSSEHDESLPVTAVETPSDQWTELDVLPDFDLTSIDDDGVSSSSSDLSAKTSSALQLEAVNDGPESPVALETPQASAASDEIAQSDKSEVAMTAETEPDKTEVLQADPEAVDEKTETDVAVVEQTSRSQKSAADTATRPEDMEAARAILQGHRWQKQYTFYAVLLILLLLLSAGGYYLFFMPPTQISQDYPPVEGMMDEDGMGTVANDSDLPGSETSVSTPISSSSDDHNGVNQAQVSQQSITPKKNSLAEKDNTPHSIGRPLTPKSQPRFQSLQASSPITIKIKRPSPRLDRDLAEAYAVFRQHDYTLAEQLYRRVTRRDPKQVDAWLGLAAIAEKHGQVKMAKALYQRVLQIDSQQTYAQNALIRLQNRQSPAEQAVLYRQLAEKYPDNAQAQAALAHFYVAQRRWRQAQEAYFKAVALAPENALYHYNLAVCLDHLGKSDAALRYYQKTLQLNAHTPQTGIDPVRVRHRIQQLQGA